MVNGKSKCVYGNYSIVNYSFNLVFKVFFLILVSMLYKGIF